MSNVIYYFSVRVHRPIIGRSRQCLYAVGRLKWTIIITIWWCRMWNCGDDNLLENRDIFFARDNFKNGGDVRTRAAKHEHCVLGSSDDGRRRRNGAHWRRARARRLCRRDYYILYNTSIILLYTFFTATATAAAGAAGIITIIVMNLRCFYD